MAVFSADRMLAQQGFTARNREQFRRLCDVFGNRFVKLLLKAVLKNPKLLTQRPLTIADNAKASARVLGIDVDAFLRLAATQPSLLYLRPEGLEEKVLEGCAAFAMPRAGFVGMCLKRPSLLTMTTARIAATAAEVARMLEADAELLACAFIKYPALLTLKPETIAANVVASAGLLGLSREQFIRCAVSQPQLFCAKPESLHANVLGSAAALSITEDAFLRAAIQQPSLLYRSPDTLAAKGALLLRIMEAVGDAGTFEDFLARNPAGLTYAPGHLKARLLLVELGLSKAGAGRLITLPTRKVDALLVGHCRSTAVSLREGERAIRALVERDIIKNPRADRTKSHRVSQSHRRLGETSAS